MIAGQFVRAKEIMFAHLFWKFFNSFLIVWEIRNSHKSFYSENNSKVKCKLHILNVGRIACYSLYNRQENFNLKKLLIA